MARSQCVVGYRADDANEIPRAVLEFCNHNRETLFPSRTPLVLFQPIVKFSTAFDGKRIRQ